MSVSHQTTARWDRPTSRPPTAAAIRGAWLASPADDGTDVLARLALCAIEERDALRLALWAALALARRQDDALDRQRELIASLRARLRGEQREDAA